MTEVLLKFIDINYLGYLNQPSLPPLTHTETDFNSTGHTIARVTDYVVTPPNLAALGIFSTNQNPHMNYDRLALTLRLARSLGR